MLRCCLLTPQPTPLPNRLAPHSSNNWCLQINDHRNTVRKQINVWVNTKLWCPEINSGDAWKMVCAARRFLSSSLHGKHSSVGRTCNHCCHCINVRAQCIEGLKKIIVCSWKNHELFHFWVKCRTHRSLNYYFRACVCIFVSIFKLNKKVVQSLNQSVEAMSFLHQPSLRTKAKAKRSTPAWNSPIFCSANEKKTVIFMVI